MLAKERRARDVGRAVGHLDRIADGQILAALRVVDFDDGARLAQRRLLGDFLHRQDRAARDVVLVEDVHRLELGLGLGPFLDLVEDLHEMRQPAFRRRIARIGQPFLAADDLADVLPHRRLRDEVDVRVGIALPSLALEDPARLPAAGRVARARHRVAELAVRVLRIFFHHAGARETLLVAQLDPAQIEDAVLHRRQHLLAASGRVALIERGDDPQRQMQSGAAIADLRAGDDRRSIVETGRRRGAARALRDVFVHLAIFVRSGTEALDRGDDHPRIELLDVFPREAHAVERAGREVLDQHVASLDQPFEDLLALRLLGIDGDRALVVIEHREVETVHAGNVAQLSPRDVAFARPLDLDDVGAQPCEQLRARRPRLHVREVQDADAVQCLTHYVPLGA